MRERTSFDVRYGMPRTTSIRTRKDFLEGEGGSVDEVAEDERASQAVKLSGVSLGASLGGGRPVIFAKSVRK